MQLSRTRNPMPPAEELPPPLPGRLFRACEWRGALGCYAKELLGHGGLAWMVPAPSGPSATWKAWPSGVAELSASSQTHLDVVVASLTDDRGEEAKRWAAFVIASGASIAAADAPRTANLEPARHAFEERGYVWSVQGTNVACYGDATARRRNLVFATMRLSIGAAEPPSLGAPRPSSAASTVLLCHDRVAAGEWIGPEEGTFTLDPGARALGGEHNNCICGHMVRVSPGSWKNFEKKCTQ